MDQQTDRPNARRTDRAKGKLRSYFCFYAYTFKLLSLSYRTVISVQPYLKINWARNNSCYENISKKYYNMEIYLKKYILIWKYNNQKLCKSLCKSLVKNINNNRILKINHFIWPINFRLFDQYIDKQKSYLTFRTCNLRNHKKTWPGYSPIMP